MSRVLRCFVAIGIMAISGAIQADPSIPVPPDTDVTGIFLKAIDNPPAQASNLDDVMSQALNSKLPPIDYPNAPLVAPPPPTAATTTTTTTDTTTAAANNNPFADLQTNGSTPSPAPASSNDLQQIQAAQQDLQNGLQALRQQDNQLKQRLDQLNQQVVQSKTTTPPGAAVTPEQQKIQDELSQLRGQDAQLQQRITSMAQELTAISEALNKASAQAAAAPLATTTPAGATETTTVTSVAPGATPASAHTGTVTPAAMTPPNTVVMPQHNPVVTPSANAATAPVANPPVAAPIVNAAPTMPTPATTANIPAVTAPNAAMPGNNMAMPVSAVNPTPAQAAVVPQTVTTQTTTIQPSVDQTANKKGTVDLTRLLAQLETWLQEPAAMLRIGGGLVALAFLMLIWVFWPKSKARSREMEEDEEVDDEEEEFEDEEPEEPIIKRPKRWGEEENDNQRQPSPVKTAPEEDPEYDLMESDDAASIRLDLARAYLEMQKYPEARSALDAVFESGTPQQKQHAKRMLHQIEQAEET